MLLAEIACASVDVAGTSSRLSKTKRLAECLAAAAPEEIGLAVSYLSGELPQGTVGVGWAALRDLPSRRPTRRSAARRSTRRSRASRRSRGPGSQAARRAELDALFGCATEPEQRLCAACFLGELRQGALEGVMVDAVARRRRAGGRGPPGGDARRRPRRRRRGRAARRGATGSRGSGSSRSRPVAADARAARRRRRGGARAGRPAARRVEARRRARSRSHRAGDEVRVFTRNLDDVTAPRARGRRGARARSRSRELVLDGEAIALRRRRRARTGSRTR